MKKALFTFVLTLVAFTANAQTYTYDVNGDGVINITDVACLVNKILGVPNPGEEPQAYLTCPDNHHPHMIDLGLPSGTKWACCNVGADKPGAYGGYYAWGETEEKDVYYEVTYQYATGEDEDDDGYYDDYHSSTEVCGVWQNLGSDIAGTGYDVAHVKWGGSWVMPSWDQIKELVNNCACVWTSLNGIEGGQFTGPSGGIIFLPAAGYRWGDNLDFVGGNGFYWSSTQSQTNSNSACRLRIDSGRASWSYDNYRYNGFTVRPVSR